MAKLTDSDVDSTIRKHLDKLRKPGVLTVRPGYEIAGHQLTGRRAIVATVHTKKPAADLARGEALPDQLAGLPVDVREASPYYRLRAIDPLAAELSEQYARPEDQEPEWPREREMPSGELVNSPRSQTQKLMQEQRKVQPHAAAALDKKSSHPFLKYQPINCPPLQPVDINADVTVAASPDAGYSILSEFLAATSTSLVVGMYDFTSGPLLADFKSALTGSRTLQMVLDSPAPNPTSDQSDWQTVQSLQAALGNRAKIARALTRGDHFATEWSFPYAYHIKVIVRDSNSFWLSSGNLNNSNEPAPSHVPKTEDRDWHIIIDDPGLSSVFGAYLNFDYETAAQHQAPNPEEIERAIEEARSKRQRESNPTGTVTYSSKKAPAAPTAPKKTFPAKSFTGLKMTVTPLLTPDALPHGTGEYLTEIMALIEAATKSIDIQLQYIEASKDATSPYGALLSALQKKIQDDVAVRLLVSANYAEKWGEKMQSEGVDLTANIHTQPDVHNKGFVVDGQTVVISSQNFSPAGVSDNRDAGVILESAQLAGYFEPIFENDWDRSLPLSVKRKSAPARHSPPPRKKTKTKGKRKGRAG